ncbi:MAG: MFS transporter [Candidatus Tectomicrobia bacterium]|nr:MFS transporter [Candidatus Tectomicrobia bacterium]
MNWVAVMGILLGHMFVDMSQNILPIVLPRLRELFSLSYTQIALVVTVMNVTSSIIQPIFGFLYDRWQSTWLIAVGIIWTGLFLGLVGLAPNYGWLLACTAAAGIGTAAFHPAATMATSAASGSRKAFGMSFFGIGGNLGFAIGPMVGALLVFLLGMPGLLFLLLPGIAAALFVYRHRAMYTVPTLRPVARRQLQGPTPAQLFSLGALCVVIIVRSWAYMSFIVFLPHYFTNQGISTGATSVLVFVFLAAGAVGGFFGGHYSDRFGRRKFIIFPMMSYTPMMLLYLSSAGGWNIVLLALAGAFLLSSFSVTVVLAQEILPQSPGLASGLSLGLSFGIGGLGVSLTGVIADAFSIQAALWLLAVVPFFAALLTLLIRTGERQVLVPREAGA